jgi:hypothetical protein
MSRSGFSAIAPPEATWFRMLRSPGLGRREINRRSALEPGVAQNFHGFRMPSSPVHLACLTSN